MSRYVLDHHLEGEKKRLALMSQLLDPMHRRYIELLGISRDARVLEVGCGNGSMSAWMAGHAVPMVKSLRSISISRPLKALNWNRGSNATMKKTMLAVLVTVAFSAVGVLGDYFLKLSSARDQPLRTRWFYIGFAVYASTAFGWVFVMRHLKLATISVVYSISMVLLLTAVGVVLFGESLNYYELAGIILAVASLVLLMRFA
jgi:drug/metabolite transporter (DMT)-like permease